MADQLDEELKNRIKKVFENHDDPSADEGWLQLRKKYPEEKANRRAILWLWWSAAALVLLFLGIGLWRYNTNAKPELAGTKKLAPAQNENLNAANNTPATVNKSQPSAVKTQPKSADNAFAASHSGVSRNGVSANGANRGGVSGNGTNRGEASANGASRNGVASGGANRMAVTGKPANSGRQNQHAANIAANPVLPPANVQNSLPGNTYAAATAKVGLSDTGTKKIYAAKPADTAKHGLNQTPANQVATAQPGSQLAKPVVAKPDKRPKSIAEMFAQDVAPPAKIAEKQQAVRFGVYAGTFVSYAKGSSNEANFGAGLSSEIRISNNLSLVTGVTIAQNSLNFGSGVPTSAAQSTFFGALSVPGAAATEYPSPFSLIKSEVTVASQPAFENYEASLVGIDVPLNLKYEFNPGKNSIYLMAGFSSGTFINEAYTYQYNYPDILSTSLQQTQDETTRKSFDGFYFAKMLNVAFGAGLRVGKNQVIVEPFLKYPLQGLGSQDIRFGSGGVNLKFLFP